METVRWHSGKYSCGSHGCISVVFPLGWGECFGEEGDGMEFGFVPKMLSPISDASTTTTVVKADLSWIKACSAAEFHIRSLGLPRDMRG